MWWIRLEIICLNSIEWEDAFYQMSKHHSSSLQHQITPSRRYYWLAISLTGPRIQFLWWRRKIIITVQFIFRKVVTIISILRILCNIQVYCWWKMVFKLFITFFSRWLWIWESYHFCSTKHEYCCFKSIINSMTETLILNGCLLRFLVFFVSCQH